MRRRSLPRPWALAALCCLGLALPSGCGSDGDETDTTPRQTGISLGLRSPAFAEGGRIPARFTCDGENVSPPLTWNRVPIEARSLAVVMQDPDAPGGAFTHWTLWDLSRRSVGLNADRVPDDALEGRNGFGTTGYSGPCPPEDDPAHRYLFRLYALNADLDLPAGASPGTVMEAITRHSIASGTATGTYGR